MLSYFEYVMLHPVFNVLVPFGMCSALVVFASGRNVLKEWKIDVLMAFIMTAIIMFGDFWVGGYDTYTKNYNVCHSEEAKDKHYVYHDNICLVQFNGYVPVLDKLKKYDGVLNDSN